MISLRSHTSSEWTQTCLADFDAFLIDHASCERKAVLTALSFTAHYPDRDELVRAMLDLADEELRHFNDVFVIVQSRGLSLVPDEKDAYVNGLRVRVKHGADHYFLDRLLIFGIIEARGCERFGLIYRALDPGPLKEFYKEIAMSEGRHQDLFTQLAQLYFPAERVQSRLEELLDDEAELIARLPIRPIVH
jgi:tRNA 2-(methylsulfanyl)-N6-isopentenyladenosine37 hydroxylase